MHRKLELRMLQILLRISSFDQKKSKSIAMLDAKIKLQKALAGREKAQSRETMVPNKSSSVSNEMMW